MPEDPVFLGLLSAAGLGGWAVMSQWQLCPVEGVWCQLGWAGVNNRKWGAPPHPLTGNQN